MKYALKKTLEKLLFIRKNTGKCKKIKMHINIMPKLKKKFCGKVLQKIKNLAFTPSNPVHKSPKA